jgi:hypothetical protein
MEDRQRNVNIFEETMAHMTYVGIEEAARKGTLVLFPAGVIEEHGTHLPLAVDVYGAYLQSRAVKSELERKGIPSLIAPPFYWGINIATGSFRCDVQFENLGLRPDFLHQPSYGWRSYEGFDPGP